MFKSSRYSKIEEYCEVCECIPCDCHGVEDELWIMGTIRTHEAREEPKLVSWKNRLASFSLVQVEGRIIEPKNRILFPSVQRDIPSKRRTDREDNKRGSGSDGD